MTFLKTVVDCNAAKIAFSWFFLVSEAGAPPPGNLFFLVRVVFPVGVREISCVTLWRDRERGVKRDYKQRQRMACDLDVGGQGL